MATVGGPQPPENHVNGLDGTGCGVCGVGADLKVQVGMERQKLARLRAASSWCMLGEIASIAWMLHLANEYIYTFRVNDETSHVD